MYQIIDYDTDTKITTLSYDNIGKSKTTFADVAIAASLQALVPRARAPFGPGTRAVWENPALAREYEDLVAWRDDVYAKHRPGG